MGTFIGVIIVGLLIWFGFVSYVRVLTRKRYPSRQIVSPDLDRFSERSAGTIPENENPRGPSDGH